MIHKLLLTTTRLYGAVIAPILRTLGSIAGMDGADPTLTAASDHRRQALHAVESALATHTSPPRDARGWLAAHP